MRIPSESLDQQQQPPPWDSGQLQQQQGYYGTSYSGHGSSIRPLIGVLVLIIILGAVSVVIGRLCSGRGIMGHGLFDFESWVEKKCSAFIDGRMDSPSSELEGRRRRVAEEGGNGGDATMSVEAAPPVVVAVVVESAEPDMQEVEATDIAQNPPQQA